MKCILLFKEIWRFPLYRPRYAFTSQKLLLFLWYLTCLEVCKIVAVLIQRTFDLADLVYSPCDLCNLLFKLFLQGDCWYIPIIFATPEEVLAADEISSSGVIYIASLSALKLRDVVGTDPPSPQPVGESFDCICLIYWVYRVIIFRVFLSESDNMSIV